MTPDQAHAAAARGILAVSQMQMQRLLGGPPLSTMELLRRLLTAAPIGASAATAAAEASAAAETKTAEEVKTAAAEGGMLSPLPLCLQPSRCGCPGADVVRDDRRGEALGVAVPGV